MSKVDSKASQQIRAILPTRLLFIHIIIITLLGWNVKLFFKIILVFLYFIMYIVSEYYYNTTLKYYPKKILQKKCGSYGVGVVRSFFAAVGVGVNYCPATPGPCPAPVIAATTTQQQRNAATGLKISGRNLTEIVQKNLSKIRIILREYLRKNFHKIAPKIAPKVCRNIAPLFCSYICYNICSLFERISKACYNNCITKTARI